MYFIIYFLNECILAYFILIYLLLFNLTYMKSLMSTNRLDFYPRELNPVGRDVAYYMQGPSSNPGHATSSHLRCLSSSH